MEIPLLFQKNQTLTTQFNLDLNTSHVTGDS